MDYEPAWRTLREILAGYAEDYRAPPNAPFDGTRAALHEELTGLVDLMAELERSVMEADYDE